MKRAVLRLVIENYVVWLAKRMPPSGQPLLHDFLADAGMLIAALPDGGLDAGELESLDLRKVNDCIEWLFMSMATAHSDNWYAKLAAHMARLMALDAAPEILRGIVNPQQTLASHHGEQASGKGV